MIEGMGHVCIGALDLGETERFYCEALGFRKLFRFLRDGQEIGFYLALPDGSFVEVFKEDDAKVSPQGLIRHLCLRVDDLDATIAALGARGIEAVGKKLGADLHALPHDLGDLACEVTVT